MTDGAYNTGGIPIQILPSKKWTNFFDDSFSNDTIFKVAVQHVKRVKIDPHVAIIRNGASVINKMIFISPSSGKNKSVSDWPICWVNK